MKAYTNKASLLICQGKYFEASKLFYDVIKKNPDYYKAYLGLGVCLENLGKTLQAKRYYKRYLELKPESKDAGNIERKLNNIHKKTNMTNPLALIKK